MYTKDEVFFLLFGLFLPCICLLPLLLPLGFPVLYLSSWYEYTSIYFCRCNLFTFFRLLTGLVSCLYRLSLL